MSIQNFNYPDRNANVNAVAANTGGERNAKGTLTAHADLRRQRSEDGSFAPEREGNTVLPFYTGESYFSDVCDAIAGASQSVFITGWQVNWAVRLKGNTRLIDALKTAVAKGAKVYVMPWLSPKVGLNTGDFATMLAVFQLNAGHKQLAAFCCPAGLQNDLSGVEETFFSHHQKLVVIDNKIAYVGGIDLAFGRRDDVNFSLDHGWRTGPEVYNTGVPPLHRLLPNEAKAFVDESELLSTSLSPALLNQVNQSINRLANTVAASRLGQWADDAVEWWQKPIEWEWLKDFNDWVDKQSEPTNRRIDEVQQSAADGVINKLRQGYITESNVTALVNAARNVVRTTFGALLQTTWVTQKANADLLKSAAQSSPGAATYLPYQPRMPWQDVQVRIEGPSVYDLSMNFIRRWNSLQASYLSPSLLAKTRIAGALLPVEPARGKGNGGTGGVKVDVLRSAPLALQQDEVKAMPALDKPVAAQQEIHDAMVAAIRGAERFIYIENQFFQSDFGVASIKPDDRAAMSGPLRYLLAEPGSRISAAVTQAGAANANLLPKNLIARAIGERIEDAIRWGKSFHAYIVLPVHPEGSLADLAIVGQIHWTMQSLVFASDSLVNRVRLALYAKKHCKEPRNAGEWQAAKKAGREIKRGSDGIIGTVFEREIKKDAVLPYLSLLNLRSCQTVAGKVCTEQAYVHSKLLIVDDRIVIVGSANINDRSLNGGRDSELAVCLTDLTQQTAPVDGKNPIPVRKLAHEMRVNLWKKHFALSGGTDIVKPASGLAQLLDKPADPATWQAVQRIAKANAAAYAQAFPWVPKTQSEASSIWPVWDRNHKFDEETKHWDVRQAVEPYAKRMPFSKTFWEKPPAVRPPAGIQGFICELPLEWTLDENNHPGMNMILLTEVKPFPRQDEPALAAISSKQVGVSG